MEFFGSRLKWSSLNNITTDDSDSEENSHDQQQIDDSQRNQNHALSLLDDPINGIQFAK